MQSFLKSEKLFSLLLVTLALLLSISVTSAKSNNLALGADPTESDTGWGGGVYPWEMVDGQTYYSTWDHGLAFTGGIMNYVAPCGWRQATLNFGTMKTFNRVMIWHHGLDHIPTIFNLLYWDGSSWKNTGGTYSIRNDLTTPPTGVPGYGATPTEHIFPTVTGSKVRFELNNCNITHGWIYEFEVFHDNSISPQPFICPDDQRLNRWHCEFAPIAVYANPLNIYAVDPATSQGVIALHVEDDLIKSMDIPTDHNVLIAQADNPITGRTIALYLLTTGEYQINTYYADGKPYIIVWSPDAPGSLYALAW